MSNRVTERLKELNAGDVESIASKRLFNQLTADFKILDKTLSKIRNLKQFLLANEVKNILLTTYLFCGAGMIEMNNFDIDEIQSMTFVAMSDVVGTGGMTVQLYDVTNAAEITTIIFVDADDNTSKTADVKAYLTGKTGELHLEVNAKRTGAGTGSFFCCARLKVT